MQKFPVYFTTLHSCEHFGSWTASQRQRLASMSLLFFWKVNVLVMSFSLYSCILDLWSINIFRTIVRKFDSWLCRFRSLEGIKLILSNFSSAAFESTLSGTNIINPKALFRQMKVGLWNMYQLIQAQCIHSIHVIRTNRCSR